MLEFPAGGVEATFSRQQVPPPPPRVFQQGPAEDGASAAAAPGGLTPPGRPYATDLEYLGDVFKLLALLIKIRNAGPTPPQYHAPVCGGSVFVGRLRTLRPRVFGPPPPDRGSYLPFAHGPRGV